jgi:hypothetical protein
METKTTKRTMVDATTCGKRVVRTSVSIDDGMADDRCCRKPGPRIDMGEKVIVHSIRRSKALNYRWGQLHDLSEVASPFVR